jgi:hypothetical protein
MTPAATPTLKQVHVCRSNHLCNVTEQYSQPCRLPETSILLAFSCSCKHHPACLLLLLPPALLLLPPPLLLLLLPHSPLCRQ